MTLAWMRLRSSADLGPWSTLPGAVGTSTIKLACGRRGTEARTELSRAIATLARTLTAGTEVVNKVS